MMAKKKVWDVCQAFKKKITGQTKSIEVWNSSYDEPSGIRSVVDPLNTFSVQATPKFLPPTYLCKQDTEAESSGESKVAGMGETVI
ncbi:hypothetical protein PVK06_038767 [Gossypium arboreum]|uniref:Uncharacterized protein n=1 Tax=Gossypium arboreum TaxID=29729 RepID=A0ABR0N2Y9_GOSAR|nr:hypothetical protein PVK06_038767 [Gossypium arboreum]